jgi:predicted phage terminase large subunit-like protein
MATAFEQTIPSQIELDIEQITRGGLRVFIRKAWHVIEPRPLVTGWAFDAVCDHTEAFFDGRIKRLLITIPPRMTKTLTTAVFAPAHKWTKDPTFQIVYASYSHDLSLKASAKCRNLIESEWYKNRFADKVALSKTQNTKEKFETTLYGFRLATSVDGTVTGEGGDVFLYDDLINVKEASSEAAIRNASEFYWEVSSTRLNQLKTGGRLVIAQRVNSKDVPGEILEREGKDWVHLNLPMEFEEKTILDMKIETAPSPLGFVDPRTEDGEILDPERFPREELDKLKISLGSYATAAQLQQRPVPREGGIIKDGWIRRFECPPNPDLDFLMARRPRFTFLSADCASKPKKHNDPTALGLFAAFPGRIELWKVWLERLGFPEAQRLFKDKYAIWKPKFILIEDKDSGQSHIQELRKTPDDGSPKWKGTVLAYNPGKLDKFTRMDQHTAFIEAGGLWIPKEDTWCATYITTMTSYSSSTVSGDDQVDMTSQALDRYRAGIVIGAMDINAMDFSGISAHDLGDY